MVFFPVWEDWKARERKTIIDSAVKLRPVLVAIGIVALSLLVVAYRRRFRKNKMQGEADLLKEIHHLLARDAHSSAEQDVARAMQALAHLVSVVRLRDGEAGAKALLDRGRALFQEREGTDMERDNALASLGREESLLKERGAEIILGQAFSDGSSVLCRKCSGLVARSRWGAHKSQWCPGLGSLEDDHDEEYCDSDSDAMDQE